MNTERHPSGQGWIRSAVPDVLRVGNEHISAWRYGRILVMSQLAEMKMPQSEVVGPTWLVSVSRSGRRPSASDVRKVRRCFDMRSAEIDNHHPGCAVNLFLPVDPRYRVDCECKDDEVTITEADGYTWTTPKDGECRGCELERMLGQARPCPIHSVKEASTL
jgi:hypothetical protein